MMIVLRLSLLLLTKAKFTTTEIIIFLLNTNTNVLNTNVSASYVVITKSVHIIYQEFYGILGCLAMKIVTCYATDGNFYGNRRIEFITFAVTIPYPEIIQVRCV